MHRLSVICAGMVLLLGWSRQGVAGTWEVVPQQAARPRVTISVWDTTRPAAEPLAPKALADRSGWSEVDAAGTPAPFKGDAVISNGRIVVVARAQSPALDVYAVRPEGAVARLKLRLTGPAGESPGRLDHVTLVEATKATVCLEVSGKVAGGASITGRVRVKRGDVALQVEPGVGAGRLRVECPGRYVVLPDFFADDILVDARTIKPDHVELPTDNFVMHLTGQGDGLVLCVFENRQQDVKLSLSGPAGQRTVAASEVGFEGKKVWVAVLDGPKLWHAREIATGDTGKVLPLDWSLPFPGQWRVDFTTADGLIDSWEMLLPASRGLSYVKPSWLGAGSESIPPTRQKWNTVLGTYTYPCWTDRQGKGYLQPLKNRALRFQGPLVVYPINRVKETPLDAFTVVDVMRNTLGVGPCEYILDLEGQKSEYRGRATCAVRDALTPIYANNNQISRRSEINQILDDGLTFVKHIRGRITRYVEFSHAMQSYLAEQIKAHPEMVDTLTELERIARQIDLRYAARADEIKTPEHVAAMNEEFRKNVLDDDGPEALARCRAYTKALVTIGGSQDELSGECRWVVKALRQRAGLLTARDPRVAAIAAVVRAKTQEALRNPAGHEGAHH
jgi:hypothetical protein